MLPLPPPQGRRQVQALEAPRLRAVPGETVLSEFPETPFANLNDFIESYIDDYEMRDCEDENGNCGDYQPSEQERALIEDAIHGLVDDEEFVDLLIACRDFKLARREAKP